MKCMFWSCCAAICLLSLGCGTSKEQYILRGNEKVEKGRYEEALLEYRNALKKDSSSAESYYRIGITFIKQNKPVDAVGFLDKALTLNPDLDAARLALGDLCASNLLILPSAPQVLYDKLRNIAQYYLAKDQKSFPGHRFMGHLAIIDSKPKDAAAHFRAALEVRPKSADISALLAQSLALDGRLEEAEIAAKQGIDNNPTYDLLYDFLYAQYRKAGREEDAESLLRRRIDASPKEALYTIKLAKHLLAVKQPKKAEALLQTLLAPGAAQSGRFLLAGDFVRDLGDPNRALEIYTRGIESDSTNQAVYYKRIVAVHLNEGNADKATRILDDLLRKTPTDSEVRASRASIRLASSKSEDLDIAIAEFSDLVAKNPAVTAYRTDLAKALLTRGDEDAARIHLLKVVEQDAGSLYALITLAQLSMQKARVEEASNYAERALALAPRNPQVRLIRSASLALQGDNEEARQELNSLTRDYPNLREPYLQLALLAMQEGRLREAESLYKQHYQPGSADPRILRGMVEAAFAAGDPERGYRIVEGEWKLRPASRSIRLLLAATSARANKLAVALEHYQWLRQNSTPSAQIEMALGLIHQETGDWASAISHFQAARNLEPANPHVLASLGFAFQQNHRPKEAIPLYREVLKAQPNFAATKNNLAMALADSGGDLGEALQLAQSAVGLDGKNPVYADALGLIFLKRKEIGNAIQSFRSAVSRDPNRVAYRIHLAKALTQGGNKQGARAELAVAAKQSPSAEERTEMAALEGIPPI